MVVFVNRLPVAKVFGRMKAARRRMENEVKVLGYGAYSLQCSPQERCQIHAQSGTIEARPLESGIVISGHNPGFVGNARRIGTQSEVVATNLDHARALALFLLNDVAKNTSLFACKVFASSPQLIQHPSWDEPCRRDLGSWVREFLPGVFAVVLEEADVFDPRIALQIKNAFGGHAQE